MLEGVVDVLKWSGDASAALDLAEDRFSSRLASLLGQRLARLEASDPFRAGIIMQLMEGLGAEALRGVVLAPETSFWLLWQHHGYDENRWHALEDSLLDARNGIRPDRSIGGLPIDASSSAAAGIDPHLAVGLSLVPYGKEDQREAAVRKVEEAMCAIEAVDLRIAAFVRRFTLAISIVTDDEGRRFSSGSVNQYVGRSILWNAHLPSVDIGVLAEALVHESIHAYLYMHEACDPWFADPEKIPNHPVVTSPWTGAALRLEPFLQACFVWFGLLHFWRSADRADVFPGARVAQGIALAQSGFSKDPLLCYIPGLCHLVRRPVAELIQSMRANAPTAPSLFKK